jgi:aminoglycoside phosphotransferase
VRPYRRHRAWITVTNDDIAAVLRTATAQAGLNADGAELIRLGENALYRLPGKVVARITRPGQHTAAAKEVNVARWLQDCGVAAIQVVPDVEQPIAVNGRAVTFWRELPPHTHGSIRDVAQGLRQLHRLPSPTFFELPPLAPFVRLAERIDGASTFGEQDRQWMRERLAELERRYSELPTGLPFCVVHGDAWGGNFVRTNDGRVVLLDLERCSVGPPEWDLILTAIDYTSLGWLDYPEYAEFVAAYGHDVTIWDGYATLRDIREFRITLFAAQVAADNPAAQEQAAHRIACLHGERGPRPWSGWRGVP